MKKYRAGVLFGEELEALLKDAKDNQFALPAVNTIGTNTINATLETAAKVNSPVIVQYPEPYIFIMLPGIMECRSFCIQTMLLKSGCPGSVD